MLQSPVSCIKAGSILRSGHGRVIGMSMDSTGHILAVHGNDNNVELFYFLSDKDAKLKLKKRLRKEKKLVFEKHFLYFYMLILKCV